MNDKIATSPNHSITATLPPSSFPTVHSTLDLFAKKYDLKPAFGYQSPSKESFLLQMSSDKFNITVIKLPNENFYRILSYNDHSSEAETRTTELMNVLRADLGAITGAKVIAEY